ncbi:hypothetical protein E4T49_08503 [Aureobasidium sp. EXF-10728]|nr:hypothetical protein E4T49_08503 [Aureobasidium sp. EXF-10728]
MPHANCQETTAQWHEDLLRDGFAVVKNAVPKQRCQYYIEQMFNWLERFPFGFDRNDKSTWTDKNLPTHMKGGMYHGYRIQHEKFVWEARQEPGVIDAFTKIWGTNELLASFDGINFTLPTGSPLPPTTPWPHVDQSPRRKGMQCVQGIINFAPNGPEDGGLLVMKGSTQLMEEFFATHPDVLDRPTWGASDWFPFEKAECEWFKDRGCSIAKVCAGPGDLIVWDSRCMHYNEVPRSQNVRALIYACYTPAASATPEALEKKAQLFDERIGTTHWPHDNIFPTAEKKLRLGKPDLAERDEPFEHPEETDFVQRLAGKKSY